MERRNIFDPETGKPRLNSRPCDTCIMNPKSPLRSGPGRLSRERFREVIMDPQGAVCHSTWAEIDAPVPPALCRGVADMPYPPQMIRIFERLGGFKEVEPPPCDWATNPSKITVPDDQEDEECGCCELGEFESTGNDDEPWCANCNHSPEEHE